MIFHRFGIFDRATGRAVSYWFQAHPYGHRLDTPARIDVGHATGETYHLPMDDMAEDWLRMHAEWHVSCDPAHRGDLAEGTAHIGRSLHDGGIDHPEPALRHVRLGGTVRHDAEAHPLVTARMEQVRQLSPRDLVRFFCGPQEGIL